MRKRKLMSFPIENRAVVTLLDIGMESTKIGMDQQATPLAASEINPKDPHANVPCHGKLMSFPDPSQARPIRWDHASGWDRGPYPAMSFPS